MGKMTLGSNPQQSQVVKVVDAEAETVVRPSFVVEESAETVQKPDFVVKTEEISINSKIPNWVE